MESYLNENFGGVKAKNSSEEALRRWRKLCGVVKNPKRRFRFTANLSKRSEAEAMKKTNQEKLRIAVLVSKAALQFIQGIALRSEYVVPEEVSAAGFQICADELASIVEGHDVKKLKMHGGVEGIINKLNASMTDGLSTTGNRLKKRQEIYGLNKFTESAVRSFWVFVWEALQDTTLIILAVCAFVSLIVGIAMEGWPKGAHDGLGIVASILLIVFVTATSDYKQSLQFKDLDKEKKKISIQVTRNGFRQKISIYDLVPGDIVHLSIGDQVPADGIFMSGYSLLINESSLTGECEPVCVNTEYPFLLSGTKVQDGSCKMLVTTVGMRTQWGKLLATLSEGGDDETPLQVKLNGVATIIGKIGLFFAVITFAVLAQRLVARKYREDFLWSWSGDDALEMLEFFAIAVTIVVVAVPEGLPLAVTLSLAFAMKKMMNDKALGFLFLFAGAATGRQCPDCGSTAVPFPLSTASGCGDPSYRVRCDPAGSALFFDSVNGSSYPITAISPATQRLVIRPAPFLSGGASCVATDLPFQGIQLNSTLPFNVSSSNTIMFFNCTPRLLLSPLNCSSNSLCHVYANATADAAACSSLPICCTFVAGGSSTSYSIRASETGCSAYRSFVNLNAAAPVAQWAASAGVELQWASPREPLCATQADCQGGASATCSPDPTSGGGLRRCFCVAGLRWDPISGACVNNVTDSGGGSNRAPLIAGLLSGVSVGLLMTAAGFLLYRRQRRIHEARKRLAKERQDILSSSNPSGRSAKHFTAKELKKATNNFASENLLGSGGFGEVYKGTLRDGTPVAVKCAKVGNTKSTDQVLNEVRVLSQVNHRSLVRLLGCCVDLDQPLMVYEFIPNGTLYDHLHGLHPPLPWSHRLAIARQTAEGLAYLHFAAVPPIYHRDVKSSNILLDEKLNAKVSDFGLSRLAEPGMSHLSTCAQGTLGYLDPEYYRNYQLTDKSDVYSFGVVLLELLTSQKAIDFGRGQDDVNLAVHVHRKVEEEKLMEAVEGALIEGASQVELDTMKAVGFLAMGCLEEKRQNRPSMKEVAEEIEYIISIIEAAKRESKSN